jgi:hypothetical protein
MKRPAQPKPTSPPRINQGSGPGKSGMTAVAATHQPGEGGIGADAPNTLDDPFAAQSAEREA